MTLNKLVSLFLAIEQSYATQHYRSGDYCAKVRALHSLLRSRGLIAV